MQIIKSSSAENSILYKTNKKILDACFLTDCEKEFINSMVLRLKPKKVLEIGVAAGGSSGIILNAIKENGNNAQLYSVDFSTEYCQDSSKLSGFATIDNASEDLKKNWHLYTGNFVSEFLDQIGDGIDFAFIDTLHWNPGEIIDFLMILPFLKKNATILFHDINLHMNTNSIEMVTNCLLMSAIKGEKILPSRTLREFINIGGVTLDKDIKNNLWDIFNCLNMPWSYLPSIQQSKIIENALNKYYDKYLCAIYNQLYDYYRKSNLLNNYSPADKRYAQKCYIIAAEDIKKYKKHPQDSIVRGIKNIKRFGKFIKIINS